VAIHAAMAGGTGGQHLASCCLNASSIVMFGMCSGMCASQQKCGDSCSNGRWHWRARSCFV
jgi:hypothetical protein